MYYFLRLPQEGSLFMPFYNYSIAKKFTVQQSCLWSPNAQRLSEQWREVLFSETRKNWGIHVFLNFTPNLLRMKHDGYTWGRGCISTTLDSSLARLHLFKCSYFQDASEKSAMSIFNLKIKAPTKITLLKAEMGTLSLHNLLNLVAWCTLLTWDLF